MDIAKELKLYLVTDRDMVGERSLEQVVEQAILGGVTMVQLREKKASYEQFLARALTIKKVCDRYNVPLIINDNVDICLAVGASGVHLGQSDGDIREARRVLGKDKIIGASARSVELAQSAEASGADYLGVGAVFGTNTKSDAKTISPGILKSIAASVSIPVVAIGGVSLQNLDNLAGSAISGVAVVSGILKAEDTKAYAEAMSQKLDEIIK